MYTTKVKEIKCMVIRGTEIPEEGLQAVDWNQPSSLSDSYSRPPLPMDCPVSQKTGGLEVISVSTEAPIVLLRHEVPPPVQTAADENTCCTETIAKGACL